MIKIAPPPPPAPKWAVELVDYNQVRVSVPDQVLTRHEAFRLIGELERAASES